MKYLRARFIIDRNLVAGFRANAEAFGLAGGDKSLFFGRRSGWAPQSHTSVLPPLTFSFAGEIPGFLKVNFLPAPR